MVMVDPRGMVTSTLIALGSNLGDPAKNLTEALDAIEKELGPLEACSHFYRTKALVLEGENPQDFPDFVNAVARISSALAPHRILAALLKIEKRLGRIRGITEKRWQPRIIDLDLLAVGETVVRSPELTLPHPELQRRDFVLVPLVEVAPEWKHPVLGKTSAELLEEFGAEGSERFVKEKLPRTSAGVTR